jgi:Fibronectin type III domain
VSSPTYPEDRWTPATAMAEFRISDSGQQPPVTSLSYALDDADPTTVSGDSVDLTLPSPSADGLHVLHISATSTVGQSGYDYAFYLGATPKAVSTVTATSGQSSVLLSWPAASGPVSGYEVQLVDSLGQAAEVGACADCTSMAISGLPAGQVLTARVSAASAAGPSPATPSGTFTVGGAGTAAGCSASGCQSVDASCTLASCDTSATTGDAIYAMRYIDMDGSSATITQGDSTPQLTSRAADGTGGNAGILAASGALSISVTSGVPMQPDGTGSSIPAQPDAATPRGYHLLGNNVIDPFHYRSDRAAVVVDKTIRGRRYLIGQTTSQLRETLYGGSSHRWLIGIQASYVAGDPYDFYYLYTCGINVPKTEDWTCNTHESDADGVYDEHVVYGAVWNTYEQHNASFGSSETRYAKFPMVDWRVTYHDGGSTINDDVRYRGWDIRFQNRTWVLAAASGTGF